VRRFDLVVVRGGKAKAFLATHGIKRSVVTITGSVNNHRTCPKANRDIDLIFVGRLSPVKQIHQFVAVVDAVRRAMPEVRGVIVGDGPLKADLEALAAQQGLTDNIEFFGQTEDVGALLARAKVFVLTSRSEGLSIAMAEAMVAGAVPVVADVGELGDLVVDGINGHLVNPDNIDEYARKAISLLEDEALWNEYSHKAIEMANAYCDIGIISERWRQHLQDVICLPERCRCREALG
jgi:glycosyltransferase involved in cell wall biosynthesis